MRNMSFFLTTDQVINRTKDVTRRFGWAHAEPGDLLCAVEKGQGIKKGEKIKRIAVISIASITVERADAILSYPDPLAEVSREGFPDMSPQEFVDMLCKANGKMPTDTLTRIEFEYTDEGVPT